MTRSSLLIIAFGFVASLFFACSDDAAFNVPDDCPNAPQNPDCVQFCQDNPADPYCAEDAGNNVATDAGNDAMTDTSSDTGTDDDADIDAETPPCDGMCTAAQICDEATDACVACLNDTNCTDGVCLTDASDSSNNACVACKANDDCESGVCDTSSNSCVACLADSDCTSAVAARCEIDTNNSANNTCAGCDDSTQCAGIADAEVCDVDSATCVECTGTDFDACDGVCDSDNFECTSFPANDAGLCEECVSDAQCRQGMFCVRQTFELADGTGPGVVGKFCLWGRDSTETNAPGGSCSNVVPYFDAQSVVSVDGANETVCGLRSTTCPGLNDYSTNCANPGDDCGADGFDDGVCVAVDAQTNRCTTECFGPDDCKGAQSCDTSVTPNLCEL